MANLGGESIFWRDIHIVSGWWYLQFHNIYENWKAGMSS